MLDSLSLIILDAFVYSFILFIRKKYILKNMPIEVFMIISSFIGLVLSLISYITINKINNKPNDFFSKITLPSIKAITPLILGILILGSFNKYLYLYLLKTLDLSYVIPLNQIFIVIFSVLIGVVALKEKLSVYNIIGLISGIFSIYLVNV